MTATVNSMSNSAAVSIWAAANPHSSAVIKLDRATTTAVPTAPTSTSVTLEPVTRSRLSRCRAGLSTIKVDTTSCTKLSTKRAYRLK